MPDFLSKLRMLIRWASVVRGGKDDKQFPVQQVRYMGKVADAVMLFPYGMHANVDGDSLGPMFVFGGNVEDRAMMPTSMNNRRALQPGEVEVYSPLTSSRVTFNADGSIEIDAGSANVAVTGGTVTVNGTVTFTGDVAITGALAVTGILTQGGTNVGATHTHSGVTPGGGTTGPVV